MNSSNDVVVHLSATSFSWNYTALILFHVMVFQPKRLGALRTIGLVLEVNVYLCGRNAQALQIKCKCIINDEKKKPWKSKYNMEIFKIQLKLQKLFL